MNNRANAFYVCLGRYASLWNNVRHHWPNIEQEGTASFDHLFQNIPAESHVEAIAVGFKSLRSDGKPQYATKPLISPPRSPDIQSGAEWQHQRGTASVMQNPIQFAGWDIHCASCTGTVPKASIGMPMEVP